MISRSQKGFTLLEVLIVIVIIGIIATLVAPFGMGMAERNQLGVAGEKIYLGLREAQTNAQHQRSSWRFSLREQDGRIEWATHPNSMSPTSAQWKLLSSDSIKIDDETTFASSGGIFYVRFDSKGNIRYRLGRITLSGKRFSSNKRCVIVSTLIGAMRKAQERSEPRDGKLCY